MYDISKAEDDSMLKRLADFLDSKKEPSSSSKVTSIEFWTYKFVDRRFIRDSEGEVRMVQNVVYYCHDIVSFLPEEVPVLLEQIREKLKGTKYALRTEEL